MLQIIRSKITGLVAKVLFIFLAIVFGVWGIGDYAFLRETERPVITVGDFEISPQRFDQEYRRTIERYRRAMGQFDTAMARQLNVADQVVQRLVNEAAIDRAVAALGIVVGDDMVRARILADPSFRGPGGQFDRNVLLSLLSQNQMNEAQFFAIIRQNMARDALSEAIAGGVVVPDLIVDRLYRHRGEQRAGESVMVANSAIAEPGQPTDEQLRELHEDNQDSFTRPEYRALTVMRIAPDDLAASVHPSEEDLREEFRTRQGELSVPERRDIEQIRFTEEAAARSARERIVAGAPFEDVAREVMGEAAPQMRLANITRRELPTDLATAFDLPAAQVSEPLRSPFGWHLLRTVRIEPATEPTFDEVRSRIELELRRRMAAAILFETGQRAEDLVSEGRTLEQAAETLGVRLVNVAAIDVDGKGPDGQPVATFARAPEALREAFTTNATQVTQLIDTRDGIVFLVRVDTVTPARLQPLDEVRERAVAMWQIERRRELARARAQEILAKVNEGKSLAEAAQPFGLAPQAIAPTARQRTGQPAEGAPPSELVAELFRLQANAAGVAAGSEGAWVVRLTEIRPADPAADQAGVTRTRTEVQEQMKNDTVEEYIGALRARERVVIDRPAIERLTAAN